MRPTIRDEQPPRASRALASAFPLTIPLVRALCAALDAEAVSYCHWKSNAFLDRSRSGENDLDLLIGRDDAETFASIVHRTGFKAAVDAPFPLPGVLDYYGRDAESGRLVHVHAHYQLVVGDDLTKSYRIPLENAVLAGAARDGELRVPQPELELILLVLRLVLKHDTWDAVLLRRGRPGPRALEEVRFLEERTDGELLRRLLDEHLPNVHAETFAACRRAIDPGAGLRERVGAGRRLTRDLRSCERRPRSADVALKAWGRGSGIVRRVLRRPPRRRRLAAGGAVIAIVGADGAGKSTALGALHASLSKTFRVRRVHLGKPPPSPVTRLLRSAVRLSRAPRRLRAGRGGSELPQRSRRRAALAAALARDRWRAARDAHRAAANGELVLSDRWPLPELTEMDAPRIRRSLDGETSGPAARLAAAEESYYRRIARPDVVIVLRVPPDVAVARRTDEPAEFVRDRWREIWAIDWEAAGAHVVDSTAEREAVAARVSEIVWAAL